MPLAVTVPVKIALVGEAFAARAFVGFVVTLTVTAGRYVKKKINFSGIIAIKEPYFISHGLRKVRLHSEQ